MQIMKKLLSISVAMTICASSVLAETYLEPIGEFDDWVAIKSKDPVECWMTAIPVRGKTVHKRNGKVVTNVDRGKETLFYVVFRSDGASKDGELSFTGGQYTFDEDKAFNLSIKGDDYLMIAQNSEGRGWAYPPIEDEKTLISKFKAGADFSVTSRSSRGTVSKDVFSLMGFTAAYNATKKACS